MAVWLTACVWLREWAVCMAGSMSDWLCNSLAVWLTWCVTAWPRDSLNVSGSVTD
jgi:hypothetical protein